MSIFFWENRVTGIDTKNKEVLLEEGMKLTYTKLIYALGSECFIPPINGKDKKEVIAIRRLEDVRKIEAMLPQIRNVVVIGGGVLGLEAAWEMKKAKCHVTVLEAAPLLMGRQLDEGAADMLKLISEGKGYPDPYRSQITDILGEEHVTGVKLAGGEVFPADLVIVSAGVRANTAIAGDAGIETDRAVVVNERMETNIPDIYACGDCAQYQGINYAIWPQAMEQGKVAGANAAGEPLVYEGVSAALNFHGMGTALFAAGDNGKNSNLVYKTVEFKEYGKETVPEILFPE